MPKLENSFLHSVSVVIPVFRVAAELPFLLDEIVQLFTPKVSANGHRFIVEEVILVHDGPEPESAASLQELAGQRDKVRIVWLSRNFGQHPATLAGMSASLADWILTLDEDGQFPPDALGALLDNALQHKAPVVYGQPTGATSHPLWRRMGSWMARSFFSALLGTQNWARFSSFRLIQGETGRAVGAYCTNETYLDVALTWVSPRSSSVQVNYRNTHSSSAYSFNRLFAHFLRMFLTMGTRPMRIFAVLGGVAAIAGFVLSGTLVYRRLVLGFPTGFASTLALLLVLTGLLLLGLAVLSEYVGLIVRSAIGRPLYVPVSNPNHSALFQDTPDQHS